MFNSHTIRQCLYHVFFKHQQYIRKYLTTEKEITDRKKVYRVYHIKIKTMKSLLKCVRVIQN